MAQRRFVVAADSREAVQLLQQPNPLRCGSKRCERRAPPVVFLFGGQGTQYVNMRAQPVTTASSFPLHYVDRSVVQTPGIF